MNKKNFLFMFMLMFLFSPVVYGYTKQAALLEKEKKYYRYHHPDVAVPLSLQVSGATEPFYEKDRTASHSHDWKIKPAHGLKKDWSHHDDTLLNHVDESDANLRGWLLHQQHYRAGLQVGYQQDKSSWTAHQRRDSNNDEDEHENTGYFSSSRGMLRYKQQYHNPYIGFVASYARDDVELNGVFKFSDWVKARDHDGDYLRKISFYGNSGDARFYSLSGNVGYYLTRATKLVVDLAYTKYDARRAGISARYYGAEAIPALCESCGGMKNENYIASIGLNYLF